MGSGRGSWGGMVWLADVAGPLRPGPAGTQPGPSEGARTVRGKSCLGNCCWRVSASKTSFLRIKYYTHNFIRIIHITLTNKVMCIIRILYLFFLIYILENSLVLFIPPANSETVRE